MSYLVFFAGLTTGICLATIGVGWLMYKTQKNQEKLEAKKSDELKRALEDLFSFDDSEEEKGASLHIIKDEDNDDDK